MRKFLMISTLLLSLIRGVWAIEPEAAQSYLPVVSALIKGNGNNFAQLLPEKAKLLTNFSAVRSDANLVFPEVDRFGNNIGFKNVSVKNSIAVIPLVGAVMKYDYCGDFGTKTLAQNFIQAQNNPNIIGIIFLNDSPGGEVQFTGNLSDLIYSLSKPVVTYIEGYCCSASYWLGSPADEIIASYKTDVIGSIGTYCTLVDYSEQMKMEGINLHEIYATKSTEKNSIWKEALNNNYEPLKKQIIDPYNDAFHAGVKRNRYGKGLSNKVFAGGTYMTNDAINNGLIDGMGNFDYAIQRIQKLAA